MAVEQPEIMITRPQLTAVAALLVFTIAAVGFARWTGIGIATMPRTAPVLSRDVHFEQRLDGTIAVTSARDGSPVARFGKEHHGFVQVVLKAVERERTVRSVPQDAPLRLVELADGRRLVEDPSTGATISLRSFGAANAAAFEQLFTPGRDTP